MYQNKKFLAIIPARGGSKGIPNKNIIELDGKPLIQYSIDAAKESKYIDKIVVSTDSEKIAEVALKCGAEVPVLRPDYLATDEAKTIDVVVHMVDYIKDQGGHFDYMVLLQPTQPLRRGFHIDEAIELLLEKELDSLASVSKVKDHPVLMRTMDNDGTLNNLLKTSSTVRRQDFPEYYKVNGSIYINAINQNFNIHTSLNDNQLGYVMDEKYDVDIDEPIDLEIARIKLSNLKNT